MKNIWVMFFDKTRRLLSSVLMQKTRKQSSESSTVDTEISEIKENYLKMKDFKEIRSIFRL